MNNSIFAHNREYLLTLIGESQDIGIIVGGDHTVDKIAAAVSLYLSFVHAQRNVQIVSIKDPLVEFSHLVGVNKIRRHFEGGVKLVTIAIPYRDGEIEKVSYNIEGDKLNINLFAAGKTLSFDERNIEYLRKGNLPSVLFTVGIASYEEISDVVHLDKSAKIVNIDSNPANTLFGDVVFVDGQFCSVSEVVAKLVQELSLPIDIDISQNLIDGISAATDNFSHPATSPYAFEATSFLLRSGAVRKKRPSVVKDTFISALEKQAKKHATPELGQQPQRHGIIQDGPEEVSNGEDVIPQDWFVPKVFKGSSQKRE